jgi:hypothetical protein
VKCHRPVPSPDRKRRGREQGTAGHRPCRTAQGGNGPESRLASSDGVEKTETLLVPLGIRGNLPAQGRLSRPAPQCSFRAARASRLACSFSNRVSEVLQEIPRAFIPEMPFGPVRRRLARATDDMPLAGPSGPGFSRVCRARSGHPVIHAPKCRPEGGRRNSRDAIHGEDIFRSFRGKASSGASGASHLQDLLGAGSLGTVRPLPMDLFAAASA